MPSVPLGDAESSLHTFGLARALKEGTQSSHQDAERVRFIHEFVKGNINRDAYCSLLVSLKFVYEALEELWDTHWEHSLLEPLYFPEELSRLHTLHADLDYFGVDWKLATPSKATLAYVDRLRKIVEASPGLLVSHAYVRYLGDLSGGQVLKKALIRGLKLPGDGSGTRFYEFTRIPGNNFKAFKNMYRTRLDCLPVDAAQKAALVEEANFAFRLNMQIFAEMDEFDLPSPKTKLPKSNPCAVCPFAHLAGLPGVILPEGHRKINTGEIVTVEEPKNEKAVLSCSKCPLARLGKHAPRIASVLTFAVAVGCQSIATSDLLSW